MGLNSILCFLQDECDNNPDRKSVRDFVDKNFDEEGTEFEDWDPIDWQQDIALYTMIRVNLLQMNFIEFFMSYNDSNNRTNHCSFLVNDTMAQDAEVTAGLIDNVGFFGCTLKPQEPCMLSIQFLQTIPRNDDEVNNTAIPR